jgi:pantothenate kinase type III
MTGYLDIGNSDIKCATANPWQEIARFSTAELSLATLSTYLPTSFTKLMIASVVPSVHEVLTLWARTHHIELVFISHEQPVVRIATDDALEVGADLIAGAAAVVGDCIVVDAGTATTLSLVEDSTLLGVAIAPGPKTQMTSLVQNTALLSDALLQPTMAPFGLNTTSALRSGIIRGHVAWIEHVAAQYPTHTIILTGGFAGLLSASMTMDHIYDPFVVYKGLQVIEDGIT